jgi:hypothetical protein
VLRAAAGSRVGDIWLIMWLVRGLLLLWAQTGPLGPPGPLSKSALSLGGNEGTCSGSRPPKEYTSLHDVLFSEIN